MTDSRLDEALKRAEERIRFWQNHGAPASILIAQHLAGWAGAIQAHAERPESEHDGGCSAGISKLPCKCSQRDRAAAIRRFCDAMLGEEADGD